jgi:hypothetical protein
MLTVTTGTEEITCATTPLRQCIITDSKQKQQVKFLPKPLNLILNNKKGCHNFGSLRE